MHRCLQLVIILGGILGIGKTVHAEELTKGNWLLRPIVGAKVNVVRSNQTSYMTPAAEMLLGGEVEYMLSDAWGIGGGIRPAISANFVDLIIAFTGKYHILEQDTPFIPYMGLDILVAFLFPIDKSPIHYNLGARPRVGIDYFVSSNFAIGLELAAEPMVMFASGSRAFELGVDALLGVSWKLE